MRLSLRLIELIVLTHFLLESILESYLLVLSSFSFHWLFEFFFFIPYFSMNAGFFFFLILSTSRHQRGFSFSTTHEFLFGAIAELVDNSRDAQADTLRIDYGSLI